VWVQGDDGTFDAATSMKTAPWSVEVAEAGTQGWRIAALLSEPELPVEGAAVRFRVEGFTTASISQWRVQLVPEINLAAFNWTNAELDRVNASLAAAITCNSPAAESADVATCRFGVVPPGRYLLAVTVQGSTHIMLPGDAVGQVMSSAFGLHSVTPNLGSILGGTLLTLRGRGFTAMQLSMAVVVIKVGGGTQLLQGPPSVVQRAAYVYGSLRCPDLCAMCADVALVVWLQVPVSTTFLNGLILCDVGNITASLGPSGGPPDVLTCMTRAHLATDASADDAMARNLEARDSAPGRVSQGPVWADTDMYQCVRALTSACLVPAVLAAELCRLCCVLTAPQVTP
jgi:hypothetical protein